MTVPAATAATQDAFLHDGADGVTGSIDRPAEHSRKKSTQQLTEEVHVNINDSVGGWDGFRVKRVGWC